MVLAVLTKKGHQVIQFFFLFSWMCKINPIPLDINNNKNQALTLPNSFIICGTSNHSAFRRYGHLWRFAHSVESRFYSINDKSVGNVYEFGIRTECKAWTTGKTVCRTIWYGWFQCETVHLAPRLAHSR